MRATGAPQTCMAAPTKAPPPPHSALLAFAFAFAIPIAAAAAAAPAQAASGSLLEVQSQPLLRNPSFEDYCASYGAGFFFDARNPSLYADSGLRNISASNSVALMGWQASGLGFQVVFGGASDGRCYLQPFWAREAGGVSQTLATAPRAYYLLRFDMTILTPVCGDSFPASVSIQVSVAGLNATRFSGSSTSPWSQRTLRFRAASRRTPLSISGVDGSCGIGVDNLRLALIPDSGANVLANAGFETGHGVVPQDPGPPGFQLLAGSKGLSPWVVTGGGVTCFASSSFPPAEGHRVIWLARQDSFVQYAGGLAQTLATQAHVTYELSFDVACQCVSSSKPMPYCQLEVEVGSQALNFTLLSQNHTAQNPGWIRKFVEFAALSSRTHVGFRDAAPDQGIRSAQNKQCAPYLDNIVLRIPAQQALIKLKRALGSPSSLRSWTELSDPCLASPGEWFGVTCLGMEVIGLALSGYHLSGALPIELLALSSLERLDLSNNLLIGSIPSFIGSMPKLVAIDLSNNKLQGSIPAQLGSLALQQLRLHNNQLSGAIPNTLAVPSLRVLSLQMNNLSGSVPIAVSVLRETGTFLTFTPGNKYLCIEGRQDQLQSCNPTP